MKKGTIVLIIIIVGILLGGTYFGYTKIVKKKDNPTKTEEKKEEVKKEEPKLKIINQDSDSRNIAVMINNIADVWGVQSGIQEAYLVYEIIVEGGYTRLMAIYKDQDLDRIGCVRSSRPYFLDYVLENDALYIHFGASDQALSDIKTLGVNNINFMNYSAGYWRDKSLKLALEHTAFTNTKLINTGIAKYGYRTTTTTEPLLNYSVPSIELGKREGAIKADTVFLDYSAVRNTSYVYDEVNKVYLRSQGTAKGTYKHTDGVTKKQYTVKNIITYQVKDTRLDKKDRRALSNVGGGKGYYITEGYAVPITWEKNTRASRTIYRYLDGTEIKVNDGNTFIQIQPLGEEVYIKAKEVQPSNSNTTSNQ